MSIWWTASRFPSLIKVLFPLLIGLALGASQAGGVGLFAIVAAVLFGWLNQLAIIFLNDAADAAADTHHQRTYAHLIDTRAIPNGWLTRRDVLIAGLCAGGGLVLLSIGLALFADRPAMPLFAGAALGFMWLYSFWPFKLNYRGAGELLETAGVGGVLPWIGFYLGTGSLRLPVLLILPLLALSFSSALSSGLKHLPADRDNGKRTAAVLFGARPARTLIIAGVGASILASALLTAAGRYPIPSVALTVLAPIGFVCLALRELSRADHQNLNSLKRFKKAVHYAIYSTELGLLLSFLLAR